MPSSLLKIENFLTALSTLCWAPSLLYDLLWKIYEDRYYYDYVMPFQISQPLCLTSK